MFVLILFIAQLGGAIYIYVQRHTVMKLLGKSITKYGDGSKAGETIKQGWDLLQVSVRKRIFMILYSGEHAAFGSRLAVVHYARPFCRLPSFTSVMNFSMCFRQYLLFSSGMKSVRSI